MKKKTSGARADAGARLTRRRLSHCVRADRHHARRDHSIVDTNILAYAEGTNGIEMKEKALDLIQRLPAGSVVVPTPVLGELFNVLVLKAKRHATSARTAILTWRDAYALSETSAAVMVNAVDLAADHHLRIWDSVVCLRQRRPGVVCCYQKISRRALLGEE